MKRFPALLATIISLTLVLNALPAHAGILDQPPPLAGWTHLEAGFADGTPQRHGKLLDGGKIEYGSPVIAEIDGNTTNGREVAIGANDGTLYVYQANGNLLWKQQVFPQRCGNDTTNGILSKPAVGALYGDGVAYVVVGYGPVVDSGCAGGVSAFDGRNGALKFRFGLREWRDSQGYPAESNYGVVSSPALADTDGDGLMEIGFGGLDRNIYLLGAARNNQGYSVRWYFHAADSVWSSPVFVNIDNDAPLEMIIGADISANPLSVPPTRDGGYVYAFDTQPVTPVRINFEPNDADLSKVIRWRTFFDQVIYSSPAVGELLAGNNGLELAVGSGCYFPNGKANKTGKWVKILNVANGQVLQTLNAPVCIQSSPALGDINGDGALEVVVAGGWGDDTGNTSGKSAVLAWNPNNPAPLWQVSTGDPNSGSNAPDVNLNTPVIADLDGNGSLEVIFANFWSVHVLRGDTGTPLTCQGSSCGRQLSLFAWNTLISTPAVGFIDTDDDLDLVVGGATFPNNAPNRGMIYAWTDFKGLLNSPAGNGRPYATPWPMFRANAGNSGIYVEAKLTASQTGIGALLKSSESRSYTITVNTTTGDPVNWTATVANDPNNLLKLERTSGGPTDALVVSINSSAAGLAAGTYSPSITVSAANLPSTTITFNVTIAADEVIKRVYLPVMIR